MLLEAPRVAFRTRNQMPLSIIDHVNTCQTGAEEVGEATGAISHQGGVEHVLNVYVSYDIVVRIARKRCNTQENKHKGGSNSSI